MDTLYDLRSWFHECDRFLFLAEVHYHIEDVEPSEHKFAYELTSSCLNTILCSLVQNGNSCQWFIDPDSSECGNELIFLKKILDGISSGSWKEIDLVSVQKARGIVHKLADTVNEDIQKENEIQGHPGIYNACRFK